MILCNSNHIFLYLFFCLFVCLFPIEPKFVGSAVIPDNDDPADDKVYYFFTERVDNMDGGNKAVYTRVGRVCAVRPVDAKTCLFCSLNQTRLVQHSKL